ncbi:hypothetical protein AZL_a05160 (plasmid) [Azospirillum sp. B510]|uniref:PAAR domain-containing protein n=1 Tax=Azospirillum sp. (strain B510) TaxID=137722 RepID=UPI0001C4BCB3|nr:hypothetical protein AZL_a05160 [Azospirillum sp. B510]
MVIGGPAARVGDMHVCPMFTGIIPHVGGPVMPPGAVNVIVGGMPQAMVGNPCLCNGPPDAIATGAPTVLVHGFPAAVMGSLTIHGGVVTTGFIPVEIGVGFAALAGLARSAAGKLGVGGAKTVASKAGTTTAKTSLDNEISALFTSGWRNRADMTPDEVARFGVKDLAETLADTTMDDATRAGQKWSAKTMTRSNRLPLRTRIELAIKNPRLTYRKLFPKTDDLYDAPLEGLSGRFAGNGDKGVLKSLEKAIRGMPADVRKSFKDYTDAWRGRFGRTADGQLPAIRPSIGNAIKRNADQYLMNDGQLAPWMRESLGDASNEARQRLSQRLFAGGDRLDLPPETLDRLSRRLSSSSSGSHMSEQLRLSSSSSSSDLSEQLSEFSRLRQDMEAQGFFDEASQTRAGFFERTGDLFNDASRQAGEKTKKLREAYEKQSNIRALRRRQYDEPTIGEILTSPVDNLPRYWRATRKQSQDASFYGKRFARSTYKYGITDAFQGRHLLTSDIGRQKLKWLAYYNLRDAGKSGLEKVAAVPGKLAKLSDDIVKAPGKLAGAVKSRWRSRPLGQQADRISVWGGDRPIQYNYRSAYWNRASMDAPTEAAVASDRSDPILSSFQRSQSEIWEQRRAVTRFRSAGWSTLPESSLDRLSESSTGRSILGEMQRRSPADLPPGSPEGAHRFLDTLNRTRPSSVAEESPSRFGDDTGYEPYGMASEGTGTVTDGVRRSSPSPSPSASALFRSDKRGRANSAPEPSRWGDDTGYEWSDPVG